MTLAQLNSQPSYSSGIYQGQIDGQNFGTVFNQIRRMYFNFRAGVFPLKDYIHVFIVLIYLTMFASVNDTILRNQALGSLELIGAPFHCLAIIWCSPSDNVIRFSPTIGLEFTRANNTLVGQAERLISSGRFRLALQNIHSYLLTNKSVNSSYWVEKPSLVKTRHSFELTNSFSVVKKLATPKRGLIYYSQAREFKNNYSNFFSFVFNFKIIPTTNFLSLPLDVANFNLYNNTKFVFNGLTIRIINDTTNDLVYWYFSGHAQLPVPKASTPSQQKGTAKPPTTGGTASPKPGPGSSPPSGPSSPSGPSNIPPGNTPSQSLVGKSSQQFNSISSKELLELLLVLIQQLLNQQSLTYNI